MKITYDKHADVLYISTPGIPATKTVEEPEGVIWRYNDAGAIVGVTLVGLTELMNTSDVEK